LYCPCASEKCSGLKTGEKLIVDVENRDIKLTPKNVDITTLEIIEINQRIAIRTGELHMNQKLPPAW
jgi:hypothetical protein